MLFRSNGYLTEVQAGENQGSTLRNDHVVRAWGGPFKPVRQPLPGALETELAVPGAPGEATLVAIAQDGASGAVLQALELPLSACEVVGLAPGGSVAEWDKAGR